MKNYLLTVALLMLAVCVKAFPNNDTTYSYLDKNWLKCDAQSATYKLEVFKKNKLWHELMFKIAEGKLVHDWAYSDKRLKASEDTSRTYDQPNDGVLVSIYKRGNIVKAWLLSKNENILGYAIYSNDGNVIEQKGYDENGSEIPNYTFMQEASFPNGVQAWVAYLKTNLKENVPVDNGAPPGVYTVTVSFLINKEGNVTEVKAGNDPGFGMAQEAIRAISNSPKWNPAIQYNKPVTYRQRQNIIFNVKK